MAAPEYRVIRRQEMTMARGLPTEATQVLVTYQAPGLPPFTIFVDKKEYTSEREHELIVKSITERRAAQT